MRPLRVTNIQRGCVYDGPGVRTTVFLKGCPMRCPWCCNPEAQTFEEDYFINDDKCLCLKGHMSKLCETCERVNGNRSIRECPFGVAEKTSIDYEPETLLQLLLRDKDLYKESKGGVTFSGGEPLYYAEELSELIRLLKKQDISLALETTLVAPTPYIEMVDNYIDNYIVDLKLQPQMMLYDATYIKNISAMLSKIGMARCIFRMVFVQQMDEFKEKIASVLHRLNINEIELLLCHNLASKKYEKLGLNATDFSANRSVANIFADYLNDNNVTNNILSV